MVLAQRQRTPIRRVPSDVRSRSIAFEREEHVDFGVLRESLRPRRIYRAPAAVETEGTLLSTLQRAADIEDVLEHEVACVDQDASAFLGEDRERGQH